MSIDSTYKKYSSVEDLLQDDYFVTSMLHPAEDTEAFWQEAIRNGAIDSHDYKLARYFIDSVQVRPEPIAQGEIFELWEDIEIANKNNLKKKRRQSQFYLSAMTGIVAVFAVLLVWNYMPGKSSVKTLVYSIEDVNVPETAATDIQLILAGNETVSLEGKDAEIAYKEDGIEINGQGASMKKEQTLPEQSVTYNQLIVPKGKRSMLSFAEGSRIWVNAGTRIVYPAVFDKKKREIYVDGEAYLEVSRNEDCPFLVKTKDFNVEVLGTSFNIMAYETDTVQNVVLVSGIVKILAEDHKQETVLSPNEMYANSKGSSEVKTVDVEDYISWKSGIYRYDSENLGTILKRLSRYYGQEISCGPQSAGLKCSGKLDLKDELETVLNGIAQTAPVVCQYSDGKYVITNQ